jgi:hypothetical protein
MNDTATFTDALQGLLDGDFDSDAAFPYFQVRTRSFAEAGVLTTNDGLVVTLSDGSEFQLTVVRSR